MNIVLFCVVVFRLNCKISPQNINKGILAFRKKRVKEKSSKGKQFESPLTFFGLIGSSGATNMADHSL